jgi:hypothetical protein
MNGLIMRVIKESEFMEMNLSGVALVKRCPMLNTCWSFSSKPHTKTYA